MTAPLVRRRRQRAMGTDAELERAGRTGTPARDESGFWDRVKSHKIIQWLVAYLGGAFVLAQAQQLVADAFAWPDVVGRAVLIALIGGVPIVLTLAWYHGHRGMQRVTSAEVA